MFAAASPRHAPWEWLSRDRVDRARLAAARVVPRHAAVSASTRMWPLLAERAELYNFPNPVQFYEPPDDPSPPALRAAVLEWAVVDTTDPEQWTRVQERARVDLFESGTLGFEKVFEEAGVIVYRRR